jgi:hypothetical protein
MCLFLHVQPASKSSHVYSRWTLQSWRRKHMYAYMKQFGKDYAKKHETSMIVGNAMVNVASPASKPP